MGCTIIGCGKALPALEVENDELAKLVDTNDEWIVTRTGISSRHVAVGETGTDLAETAARAALGWSQDGWCERSPWRQRTSTWSSSPPSRPTRWSPSAAGLLRERLGLEHAIAFDLNAACTGFIYGLTVAESMMAACAPRLPGRSRPQPRAPRPGGGRRAADAHHRLGRPQHLRAVRRRGGGRRDGMGRGAPWHPVQLRAEHHRRHRGAQLPQRVRRPRAVRRGRRRPVRPDGRRPGAVHHHAGSQPRKRGLGGSAGSFSPPSHLHGWPEGVQVRRRGHDRGHPPGARPAAASPWTTLPASCLIRPTSASSSTPPRNSGAPWTCSNSPSPTWATPRPPASPWRWPTPMRAAASSPATR